MRQVGSIALILAALLALVASPVRAGLIISFNNDNPVAVGSTAFVDVFISSNADVLSPDKINNFQFDFLITTSGPTRLEFTAMPPTTYLDDPSYLFHLDSTAGLTSSPVGTASQTDVPNDTFIGADSTFSFNSVNLSSVNSPKLLARLQVTAITSLPPALNDTFTISLVASSGNGSSLGNASSYFDVVNASQDELSAVPFTSTPGTVTITAVPEPATLLLVLGGGVPLLVWRRYRRPMAA
ncbi:MAG: hypothetical protein JWN86_872 [Planctomycetota bacterium]|nr:hypothetical protein [Planctomycetota bacterium]